MNEQLNWTLAKLTCQSNYSTHDPTGNVLYQPHLKYYLSYSLASERYIYNVLLIYYATTMHLQIFQVFFGTKRQQIHFVFSSEKVSRYTDYSFHGNFLILY